ncbi:MAG: hypothetical protein ACFFCE_05800 [Promethearchaeota archaeon]
MKNKIFSKIVLLLIVCLGFNLSINKYTLINSNLMINENKRKDNKGFNINDESDFFSNLTNVPDNPNDQYNYYRNRLLEQFNLTLSDYYYLSENDTLLFNNYLFALWGYENGTLTKEETQELVKHNSPSLTFPANDLGMSSYYGLPTLESLIRHDDEEFRMRFKVKAGSTLGERITRVDAWLDEWHVPLPNLLNPDEVHQLDIQEHQDDFHFGHPSGKSWVGSIWGVYGVRLDAVMNPHFLDSRVKIFFKIEWDWWDFWGWHKAEAKVSLFNEVVSSVQYPDNWPVLPIQIEWVPINIIDDDTTPPRISNVVTVVNNSENPTITWNSAFGYLELETKMWNLPGKIKENQVNGFHDDHALIIYVEDDSFDDEIMYQGNLHIEIWLDDYANKFSITWPIARIRETSWWFGFIPIPIYRFGVAFSLKDLPKGLDIHFSVQADDNDTDRVDDTLYSEKFNFTLSSAAPLPTPETINIGQLITNFDDIYTDFDVRYYDPYTKEEYGIVPFKQVTEPTELYFNLTLINTNNYPIRFQLNYTQFENSPRLTTQINSTAFNIIKHTEGGRINLYEGFGDQTPETIEDTFFHNDFASSIQTGGIGSCNLWIEIDAGEIITIENFLTLKVNNLSIFSDLIKGMLVDYKKGETNAGEVLESGVSTFLDFFLPRVAKGKYKAVAEVADKFMDQYKEAKINTDKKINDYFQFKNIPLLSEITSLIHFGIRIEKLYYPRDYNSTINKVFWNVQYEENNPDKLKDVLYIPTKDNATLGFDYNENNRFYSMKMLLIPTDDQVWALKQIGSIVLSMSMAQYVSQIMDGVGLMSYIYGPLLASGMNSMLYDYIDIANGKDPIDQNYDQKPNPEIMDLPTDLFPELLEEDPLARRTLAFIKKTYECEKNLFGMYISMNRYHTAVNENQWSHALNQINYALNFSKNIKTLTLEYSKDLAFIITTLLSQVNELSIDIFSDEMIDQVRDNFAYDSRYLTCLERQANFREDDSNDNSLELTEVIIQSNTDSDIRRVFSKATESVPFSYNMNQIYNNIENSFIVEHYWIQINRLNLPIIDNDEVIDNLHKLENKMNQAKQLFNDSKFQICLTLLDRIIPYCLNNFTNTRYFDFYTLYAIGMRLQSKTEKYNQINLELLDESEKEVKNGDTVEFLFKAYNDVNIKMKDVYDIITPQIEILGLPSDFVTNITFVNSTKLTQNMDNKHIIGLKGEEEKLLKLIIKIPENSPYENSTFNFKINITQNLETKTITAIQDLVVKVLDDDTIPPELSDLIISVDIHYVNVSLKILDESGIASFEIFINKTLIESIDQIQTVDIYTFILKNQWIMNPNTYEIELKVTDADNDLPGDSLSSFISVSFEISLEKTYEYVEWQIEEIKRYIGENICYGIEKSLNWKLSQAQECLNEALDFFESGEIICGLYNCYMANNYIQIFEYKIKIFNRINCINDYHTEYIIDTCHEIRNNIVILKGVSTSIEQAYDIAYIEIQLLDLQDFIEEEIQSCAGICVRCMNSHSIGFLELALFKISMDYNIEWILEYTLYNLELTISMINYFSEKGSISEDEANYLIGRLSIINFNLQNLLKKI